MKTKYTMMAAFLACAGMAAGQEVDDMYFNARDRVTHNEAASAAMAMQYADQDLRAAKTNPVNPSDTYTGRGVNPEYSAQQKNGAEIVSGNPDYFLASYAPKNINNTLYSGTATTGSSCGCNPYTSAYSGFGNPYGSFYSPYGYSPYGFSPYSSMGFGSMYSPYGSAWNISMMYGMGSMYGMPMYGMGGMYGYGMYNPYGYYAGPGMAYGYDPIQTTYGRRSVRASTVVQPTAYANPGYVAGTNGRTRATRTDYYDSQWRSNPSNFPTRSYDYSGGRSGSSYGSYSSGRSSSYQGYDGGTRTRSYGSYDSYGGGSRSMGSSYGGGASGGGSSSGGGRSRGRN